MAGATRPQLILPVLPTHRRLDFFFLACLLFSLVVHLLGGLGAQYVQVGDIEKMEHEISDLFQVDIVDLGAKALPPPETVERTEELTETEREHQINSELEQLESLPAPPADDLLENLIADQTPFLAFSEEDRLKLQGAGLVETAPPALITTEDSRRSVSQSGALSGTGDVDTVVTDGPIQVDTSPENRERAFLAGLGTGAEAIPSAPPSIALGGVTPMQGLRDSTGLKSSAVELQPPSFADKGLGGVSSEFTDRPSLPSALLPAESDAISQRSQQVVNLDDLLSTELFIHRPQEGPGYFHLRIRPQRADSRLAPLPKDLIFVIDASQSMGARTLERLKQGVKESLRRLRDADRYTVVGFRNRVVPFSDNLIPATPLSISEAWSFIDTLQPSGRTDIYTSIEPLMRLGTERARPHILVLFSDGRPNVGITDSRNIINQLSASRAPSTTIYAFGAGSYVNRYLLDFLAYRNRGYSVYSDDRSDIPFNIQKLMSELENPVLMRVRADLPGLDVAELYPKELPDLFQNSAVDIYGRLNDQKEIAIRIVGEAFDETKEMVFRVPIPAEDNAGFEVAQRWAYQKMLWLIGQTVQLGETPSLISEIKRIGADYNVNTGYDLN